MISTEGTSATTTFLDNSSYMISNEPGYLYSWNISKPSGSEISPILYFKYIKSKFNFLQIPIIEKRLKFLEEAFNEAVNNGQTVLAEKFLADFDRCSKETFAFAKGLKYYIELEDLNKFKKSLGEGHISDTEYSNYTRVIPKRVIKEKQKYDGIFDSFVIYHYYNEKQEDLKEMSSKEKEKMKDPVLFGIIKGSTRRYFIADWEDEYCDLRFEDIIKHLGKNAKKQITKVPDLNATTS